MRKEDQVVSIDIAMRLKALGMKQEALKWWDLTERTLYGCHDGTAVELNCVAAFSVAELGELLPVTITVEGYAHHFESMRLPQERGTRFRGCYASLKYYIPDPMVEEATEADMRGMVLVHLLERGYLKEINQEEK